MVSRVIGAVRRSAALAALLSFVGPGLGQGWVGKRLRAVLFAAPIILLVVVGLLVVVTQGRLRTEGLLLQPQALLGLLALNLGILVYRLMAIARYQFWPPDINDYLDTRSLMLIHQMVAHPFLPIPASTPAPSGATPAPTSDSGGGC